MRIIVVSDLHLTLKENYGVVSEEGLNSRVFDKLNALSYSVDYAIKNKADLFIDTGDTFDILNPPEILRYKFIEAVVGMDAETLAEAHTISSAIEEEVYDCFPEVDKLIIHYEPMMEMDK